LGVPKETAAKFSFLILLPAAVGGIMLESKGMTAGLRQELVPYTIGFAASLIVGYISLDFLMKIVKNGKLHYFAYYVIPLGVISILTSIYFI
jgi:undecaprenyl-diphosphatase